MNFIEACLDEIALEGLDGITLPSLWIRLAARKPPFPLKLDDSAKEYLWNTVIRDHQSLDFYELPKPRPPVILYDRFKHTDPETGVVVNMDDHPKDIYPINVIKDHPNGIMGSCADFNVRKDVSALVRQRDRSTPLNLHSAYKKWGEKLVIVGSQELRTMALFGCRQVDPDVRAVVTDVKYAVLERIGRTRYQGEVTQTEDGLKVFDMQPKSMFYIRKILRNVGIITVQSISIRFAKGSSVNGKLVHLTRFCVEFRPMYLVWLEDLTSRLTNKPNQREQLVNLRSEMGIREQTFKKLLHLGSKFVKSELLKYRDMFPDAEEAVFMRKSKTGERCVRMVRMIRPFKASQILEEEDEEEFAVKRDEDNEDDDLAVTVATGKEVRSKGSVTSLVMGRTMLHQAVNCIEKLGGRGQSMLDLAVRFSMTKLDSRNICRNLLRKGVTASVMQDEGKTRVARFVVKSALLGPTVKREPGELNTTSSQFAETQDEGDSVFPEDSFNKSMDASRIPDGELTLMDENEEKQELLRTLEVFPENATLRSLKRAKMIVTAVLQAKVVTDLFLIKKKKVPTATLR